MKYLVATFKIEVEADLMQVCRDLLADSSAEAGFESFEETEQGLEAYVQKDFFDKEALDNSIADFPIESARNSVKRPVDPISTELGISCMSISAENNTRIEKEERQ